jgi:hypothetical protein
MRYVRDMHYLLGRADERSVAYVAAEGSGCSESSGEGREFPRGAKGALKARSVIRFPIVGVQGPEKDAVHWPIQSAALENQATVFERASQAAF